MIQFYDGDILTAGDICDEPVFICHQTNCCGVMGAGLAKQIKNKYPKVYEKYRQYCLDKSINYKIEGKSTLLGRITVTNVNDKVSIVNCFGQDGYSHHGCMTDYDAVKSCFRKINMRFAGKRIAIPYKFGCGLAGGDWNIVLNLIQKELSDCKVEIWRFDNNE